MTGAGLPSFNTFLQAEQFLELYCHYGNKNFQDSVVIIFQVFLDIVLLCETCLIRNFMLESLLVVILVNRNVGPPSKGAKSGNKPKIRKSMVIPRVWGLREGDGSGL